MSDQTYLTTEELASRLRYVARTIRDRLKDSVLLEGVHSIHTFGGRKILYLWATIQRDMEKCAQGGGFVVCLVTINLDRRRTALTPPDQYDRTGVAGDTKPCQDCGSSGIGKQSRGMVPRLGCGMGIDVPHPNGAGWGVHATACVTLQAATQKVH
jgi:hypothetical protein